MKHKILLCALGAGLSFLGTQAWALPSFCTGAVQTVATGDFVAGSFLVNIGPGTSTGNCVLASDKYFGGFSVGGAITGGGSAGWLFTMGSGPADVTIGFQGLVGPNSAGNVDYSVEVNPGNSNGALIDDLQKDFTFNGLAPDATATLTGTISPSPSSFSLGGDPGFPGIFHCTRTETSSTCPQEGLFNPLTTDLIVNETITSGPDINVTGLTDTISQAVPGQIGEPATLAVLGGALFVFGGLVGWRSRSKFSGSLAV